MPLLDMDTGAVAFEDGLRLEPHMPAAMLSRRYSSVRDREVFLDPSPVTGGTLAPVCLFRAGELIGVALYVATIGGKDQPGADRQRAFLARRLHLKDPCPDTQGSVRVRCPFGEVLLSTDPHTGQAATFIQYAARR